MRAEREPELVPGVDQDVRMMVRRLGELLCVYRVRVSALDLGKKEREAGAGDTAAEEDCKRHEVNAINSSKTSSEHVLHRTLGVPMVLVS